MHENCTKLLQERPGHTISIFQTFLYRVSHTLDAIDLAIMVPQVSDVLSAVEEGDIIVSAKVTDGMQYLVQPK